MNEELKSIRDHLQEIKDKMGITSFEMIMDHHYSLYRKIEDLIKSRDNWKNKYKNEKAKNKEKSM